MDDSLDRIVRAIKRPQRVAIVGDIMLDEHVWCDVLGISPEDDLAPKVKVRRQTRTLGGAANVAANLSALGTREVYLFGRLGEECDADTDALYNLARAAGIQLETCTWEGPTTKKTRYLTKHGRHIARVDREKIKDLSDKECQWMVDRIRQRGPFEILVVSDYNKGVVTAALMRQLRSTGCLLVDPKGDDFSKYGKPSVLTPNEVEMQRVRRRGDYDEKKPFCDTLIITGGHKGCYLGADFDTRTRSYARYATHATRARELGDPAGCGDSFIAGLAFAMLSGLDVSNACRFANACGACAYDHTGVRAVTREEVAKELKTFNY